MRLSRKLQKLLSTDSFASAIEHLSRLTHPVEKRPILEKLDRAWEALGGAAIDARDWGRAEQAHRALLRLRPRDVNVTLRLAAVLARQSKWEESEGALRRARALDPAAPIDPRLAAYVEAHARPAGRP